MYFFRGHGNLGFSSTEHQPTTTPNILLPRLPTFTASSTGGSIIPTSGGGFPSLPGLPGLPGSSTPGAISPTTGMSPSTPWYKTPLGIIGIIAVLGIGYFVLFGNKPKAKAAA